MKSQGRERFFIKSGVVTTRLQSIAEQVPKFQIRTESACSILERRSV